MLGMADHLFWWDGRADYGPKGGVAAPRGIVLSFGAKESTKESMRHGDSGKKPLIAHFGGGARYVARNGVGHLSLTFGARSELAFFRRQNGRAFFPPLPIAALAPAVGVRHNQMIAG